MGLLCWGTLKELHATPTLRLDSTNLTKGLHGVVYYTRGDAVDEVHPNRPWWSQVLRPRVEARV